MCLHTVLGPQSFALGLAYKPLQILRHAWSSLSAVAESCMQLSLSLNLSWSLSLKFNSSLSLRLRLRPKSEPEFEAETEA